MDMILGFFGQFMWLILGGLGVLLTIWGWGKSKERKGRKEAEAESREAVRKVETEMQAEINKPRTTDETSKRLDEGKF